MIFDYGIYALSVFVSFVSVSIKGFQHKNVIGGHEKTMVATSFLMASFDYLTVTLIVVGGWWIILTSGTGAAAGMLFSTRLHDYVFKKPNIEVEDGQ